MRRLITALALILVLAVPAAAQTASGEGAASRKLVGLQQIPSQRDFYPTTTVQVGPTLTIANVPARTGLTTLVLHTNPTVNTAYWLAMAGTGTTITGVQLRSLVGNVDYVFNTSTTHVGGLIYGF